MICGSCGHENAPGQKFCGECGNTLSSACPSCGTVNEFGEWLAERGSDEAGPMLEEARGIFERLDARPWLERLGSGAPALDGRLAPAS